jgi:hypothetical protein
MNGAIMLGIIGLICSCGLATASCDLADFDQTEPPSIVMGVDNQFAKFQWGTDADQIAGRFFIWHYIKNQSKAGLGGIKWNKAQIRVPLLLPLANGEAFCNHKAVGGFRKDPDYDAPIVYGLNPQEEPAAVYVKQEGAALPSINVFDTAYLDQQGKKVDVHIGVFSQPVSSGFSFQLEIVPNLTIALSRIPKTLSSSELNTIVESAASQRAQVKLGPLGQPPGLNEVFSPSELAERVQQDYLFFSGAQKTSFKVETSAIGMIDAEIVVLDKDRVVFREQCEPLAKRLVLSGLGALLGPAGRP